MNAIDCLSPLTLTKAKALKASGIDAVGRYLNNLTASEVKSIHDAGLDLFTIYETTPTHPDWFTYAQGVTDAKDAVKRAQALSQPVGTVIFLPVDYDAQPSDYVAIQAYYKGARSAIGAYLLGGYGSYAVIEYLAAQGICDVLWQTVAWSYGKVSSHAHMYQKVCDTTFDGVRVDLDEIRMVVPMWGVNGLNVTQGKVFVNGESVDTLVLSNTNYVPWTVLESLPGFTKTYSNGEWHFTFTQLDAAEAKKLIQQGLNLL